MPVVSFLTFFAISIFSLLTGFYIFFIFYNKQTKATTDKFIRQVSELKPTILKNIKLRQWTTNGLRLKGSVNNYCDLYLFSNCLAIVRRQNFIFQVFFAPIILTSDAEKIKYLFKYLEVHKPERITFKQTVKGDIDIKLIDPIHKHYITDITLQGLTNEQVNQLEILKNWG